MEKDVEALEPSHGQRQNGARRIFGRKVQTQGFRVSQTACFCFSAKTFTKILALITLTCALLVFFDRTTFSTSNHEKQSDAASAKSFFEILGCLLWIAASLCALLAIRFDKLSCVVPFYVMSVISTAVSMLACAASIFILAIPPKHLIGDSTKESAVTCLLASLFTTPLSVYFTICVRRCYQDFKIHCSRRKTECENGYE
ncbi:hypothetical protein QR680_010278 [Steinernema hermaphroditum]|uniref:Uncharacterized protein n=1 Tax=Steinernema hermaphroditum TaxID=289476 RepID=A0AA39MAE4_9BILA|nr:hypothetical protein QR680_010278 [Steinernema hermaphroditum]